MKILTFALLVLVVSLLSAQQTQPPVLQSVVQYAPVNSYNTATTNNSVSVTVTGVPGQRIRIYSIKVWCGGAPGSGIVPGVDITDAGTTVFSSPGGAPSNTSVYPIGQYSWLPGLTLGVGNTAVLRANNGGACTQGTFFNIQADQF